VRPAVGVELLDEQAFAGAHGPQYSRLGLPPMDAAQALADLTEISSQIETAVVFRRNGGLAGSTLADGNRAERLAGAAKELLDAAESVRAGDAPLTQLEVATQDGSVFVVRDGDTYIAATTGTEPTV